jgi:hypothetical protein
VWAYVPLEDLNLLCHSNTLFKINQVSIMQDFISTTNSSNQSASMNQQFSPLFRNSTWTDLKVAHRLCLLKELTISASIHISAVDGQSFGDWALVPQPGS